MGRPPVGFSPATATVEQLPAPDAEIKSVEKNDLGQEIGVADLAAGALIYRGNADYAGADVWRVTRNGSATAVIQNLRSPVAMARSGGLELAVGSWGDSSVRRYQLGDMR